MTVNVYCIFHVICRTLNSKGKKGEKKREKKKNPDNYPQISSTFLSPFYFFFISKWGIVENLSGYSNLIRSIVPIGKLSEVVHCWQNVRAENL